MRIGAMDRELIIKRMVDTGQVDGLYQPIKVLQTIRTVWAEKIHKAEDERFAASQRYASRMVTFRTYWIDGLLPTDVLECDGFTYDIKGIRELGFREGTEIAAEWQS